MRRDRLQARPGIVGENENSLEIRLGDLPSRVHRCASRRIRVPLALSQFVGKSVAFRAKRDSSRSVPTNSSHRDSRTCGGAA